MSCRAKSRRVFVTAVCAVVLVAGCATPRAPVASRGADGEPGPAPATRGEPAIQDRSTHVVAAGDTLYSIAWRYGFDYRDLARWNGVNAPYVIYPGQSLRLTAPPAPARKEPERQQSRAAPERAAPAPVRREPKQAQARSVHPVWQWPTQGKILHSDSPTSKKGIDIAGSTGQRIGAAAAGAVVYSGSGLRGYGRLIIIKHNENYLSAYAHNAELLVNEGDTVEAGQQIATMGLGNAGQPVLHFEIRKDGKPVDPLAHLPKSSS